MIIVCSISMRVEEKCLMLANQYTLQGLGLDIITFWQQYDLIVQVRSQQMFIFYELYELKFIAS
jgi:hypothetical protein